MFLDSIMLRFIQISEHIKKLTVEFKKRHTEIPWRKINELRNRILHEYGKVDLNIVYNAVKVDIYVIKTLFDAVFE
ncbi:MAG: DUF86 domain-containing protein [Candidatus Izemoplasmataceae bacterium]